MLVAWLTGAPPPPTPSEGAQSITPQIPTEAAPDRPELEGGRGGGGALTWPKKILPPNMSHMQTEDTQGQCMRPAEKKQQHPPAPADCGWYHEPLQPTAMPPFAHAGTGNGSKFEELRRGHRAAPVEDRGAGRGIQRGSGCKTMGEYLPVPRPVRDLWASVPKFRPHCSPPHRDPPNPRSNNAFQSTHIVQHGTEPTRARVCKTGWGACSHSAGTAPIITLCIPGTPLQSSPLQKRA